MCVCVCALRLLMAFSSGSPLQTPWRTNPDTNPDYCIGLRNRDKRYFGFAISLVPMFFSGVAIALLPEDVPEAPPDAFYYPSQGPMIEVTVLHATAAVTASQDVGTACHEIRHFIDRGFLSSLPGACMGN